MPAVVNAALPVFALILAGWLSGKRQWLSLASADALNRFVVYLSLPALLALAMARTEPQRLFHGGFVAAFAGGIFVTAALAFWLAGPRKRRLADLSIESLAASYANAGFMGIPLCLMLFGDESLTPSVLTVLLTACVLFGVSLALIELDTHRGSGFLGAARKTGVALIRNPLVAAPLIGIAWSISGLALPVPLENFLDLLGSAASPCALVCIGLFLAQPRTGGDTASVVRMVVLKLLIQPAVTALLAFGVFDIPSVWAWCAVIMAALPIGTGPFMLAQLYQRNASAASRAILISTVISVITVPALILLMEHL